MLTLRGDVRMIGANQGALLPNSPDNLTAGVLDLIWSAGPVAKLVLAILAIFSIISWALIVEKWWQLRRVRSRTVAFLKVFREARRPSGVALVAKKFRDSPLAQLYLAAYQELSGTPDALDHGLEDADDAGGERLAAVDRAMRRQAGMEVAQLERYLPFLATTASACPFIGLFGTVWGVMSAFHGIGAQGSASLAVVAPGISEALITTAAGLAAAIPAAVFFNHYSSSIRVLSSMLDDFALEFLNIVERNFT